MRASRSNRSFAWAMAGTLAIAAAYGQAFAVPTSKPGDAAIQPSDAAINELLEAFDMEPRGADDLPWLADLNEARRKGMAASKPILVFVRSSSCIWCERLERELAAPEVRVALSSWILVRLDADASPAEVGALGVVAVPALRALSAGGMPVGGRDGYLPAAELVKWLAGQQEAARTSPDAVLLERGMPTVLDAVKIVRLLDDRRAEVREAAIRRLMPYPMIAGHAVASALEEGSLARKLSAMEVLEYWKAPVEEIDPWRPKTITEARLQALKEWLSRSDASPPEPAAELTDSDRAEASAALDRLVRLSSVEARAQIERLARLGRPLLPLVVERLRAAEDDTTVARLRTLRYRLLAADDLVLTWPGGIERLASTDADQRHAAAAELVARCGPDDNDLLVELFSDPDPLIREISLQALAGLDVEAAHDSLVRLLDDPEPNVRAAVLKELAERPVSPSLCAAVARYVAREKDADLVVHAVRVLRKAEGAVPPDVLIGLLDHPAWQVRAEATEALGEVASPYQLSQGGSASGRTAAIYAALLKRLSDEDSFVVSRAVEGLEGVDMELAVEPLLQAARNHPDLVENIIQILLSGETMRPKAVSGLTEFVKNEDPRVCAAALRGLATAAPNAMTEEVTAALAHPSREVRIAAARTVLSSCDKLRQQVSSGLRENSGSSFTHFEISGSIDAGPLEAIVKRFTGALSQPEPPPTAELPAASAAEEPPAEQPELPATPPPEAASAEEDAPAAPAAVRVSPWDAWLEKHVAEKDAGDEVARRREHLQKMLTSDDNEERATAAAALVCMGRTDKTVDVLAESIAADRSLLSLTETAMPWMTWPLRRRFFEDLRSKLTAEDDRTVLWGSLAQGADSRTADYLWQQLAAGELGEKETVAVSYAIRGCYGDGSDDVRLAKAAEARLAKGAEHELLPALFLLAGTAPDKAVVEAAKIVDREDLPATLRDDAFQILLAAATKTEATKQAVAALDSQDDRRRKQAVLYLARGADAVRHVRQLWWVYVDRDMTYMRESGKPIVPMPPKGVEPDQLRPLLADPDPEIASAAGYLLALLGDEEGLRALVAAWREQSPPSEDLDRLVYRAIAALDDSSRIAELRAIYARLDSYDVSEFYWTIRIMTGESILKFRKEIRDKVGMNNLR